jgi:hypothetical protein
MGVAVVQAMQGEQLDWTGRALRFGGVSVSDAAGAGFVGTRGFPGVFPLLVLVFSLGGNWQIG